MRITKLTVTRYPMFLKKMNYMYSYSTLYSLTTQSGIHLEQLQTSLKCYVTFVGIFLLFLPPGSQVHDPLSTAACHSELFTRYSHTFRTTNTLRRYYSVLQVCPHQTTGPVNSFCRAVIYQTVSSLCGLLTAGRTSNSTAANAFISKGFQVKQHAHL